jgi:hypothetical protein
MNLELYPRIHVSVNSSRLMDDASRSTTPRVQHDVIPVFEDFMLELLLLVKCRLDERKRFKGGLFKADGLALQKREGG